MGAQHMQGFATPSAQVCVLLCTHSAPGLVRCVRREVNVIMGCIRNDVTPSRLKLGKKFIQVKNSQVYQMKESTSDHRINMNVKFY